MCWSGREKTSNKRMHTQAHKTERSASAEIVEGPEREGSLQIHNLEARASLHSPERQTRGRSGRETAAHIHWTHINSAEHPEAAVKRGHTHTHTEEERMAWDQEVLAASGPRV